MSAYGHKQTCAVQKGMSALPLKADICSALAHVCFGATSGHSIIRSRGRETRHAPTSYLTSTCVAQRYSIHSSQGFHDRKIVHPNQADPRIIQIDSHPQSNRKNNSVNGIEYRK